MVILARYAKIRLANDDLDLLARVNVYNIRARYQDYKKSLFKQADKKFTRRELVGIKNYFYKIKDMVLINQIAKRVSPMIEAFPIPEEEFKNKSNPFLKEALKTGEKVG